MKTLGAVTATLLLLGCARSAAAETPKNSLVMLEKKLCAAWKGESACQGDLTLRADGTFEKTRCGPGSDDFAGTWEVRWDALPPTLVMTCKTSTDPAAVGKKDEVRLIKLDDKVLVVAYLSSDFQWQYSRAKK